MKQNKKAIIYVRTASDEQVCTGAQEQTKQCHKYCEVHKLDVKIEITEFGSGSAMYNSGLTEQIKQLVKNQNDIDAVVIHDISRISRSAAVMKKFMNDMKKLDIQLHVVKENRNAELSMAFANAHSEALSKKIKAGIERKKKQQEKNRIVTFTAKGRNGKKYECETKVLKTNIYQRLAR